jgi:hypothetical protein
MAKIKGWTIDEKTFPRKENIETQIKFLLRYAILAPSTYNTQPWKFKIEKNKLIIKPDFTKKLPAKDPKNRELWISIGGMVENFRIFILNLIKKANNKLFSNKKYVSEYISWIRFNSPQLKKRKDGISYKVLDVPATLPTVGKKIMDLFMNSSAINAEDEKKILNSSGIIILTSTSNEKKDWIKVGRTLEKTLLKLTALKIDYAFMNTPCEVATTKRELHKITKEYPQIILRLGHAKDIMHSIRKNLDEFLE